MSRAARETLHRGSRGPPRPPRAGLQSASAGFGLRCQPPFGPLPPGLAPVGGRIRRLRQVHRRVVNDAVRVVGHLEILHHRRRGTGRGPRLRAGATAATAERDDDATEYHDPGGGGDVHGLSPVIGNRVVRRRAARPVTLSPPEVGGGSGGWWRLVEVASSRPPPSSTTSTILHGPRSELPAHTPVAPAAGTRAPALQRPGAPSSSRRAGSPMGRADAPW